MNVLIVGASGGTGKQLVNQLLHQRYKVKAIMRSPDNVPATWKTNNDLQIIGASLLELSDKAMEECTLGCQAIVSCLGHNLTWKGIYGHPRKLVTNGTKRLCKAIEANKPEKPVKYILMNTSGNRNRDLNEPISFVQKIIIGLLRLILPPHVDNEKAADYLRTQVGQNNQFIEWTAVRPDGLANDDKVTDYEILVSPNRSAIFNAGKVSRINVAQLYG